MDAESWAVDRAISLSEVWALIAAFRGLVGACRLLGVCRAARTGAKEFLGSLQRLVVCCGRSRARAGGASGVNLGAVNEVWGLDLVTMQWEAMPALLCARAHHACCSVRGSLIVLGGLATRSGALNGRAAPTSRVEMRSNGEEAFVELPPLSCGAIYNAAAIAVDESQSALGRCSGPGWRCGGGRCCARRRAPRRRGGGSRRCRRRHLPEGRGGVVVDCHCCNCCRPRRPTASSRRCRRCRTHLRSHPRGLR